MAHASLTAATLRERLNYDPDTGKFTWRVAVYNGLPKPGTEAGSLDARGYVVCKIEGRRCQAHRLAWLYMYGEWPKQQIDHINRDPADNRIANLREASAKENHQNMAPTVKNKSGFIGVSWNARQRKWLAHIKTDGKTKHLGCFDDPAEAGAAYWAAKPKYHTFHPTKLDGNTRRAG